MLAEVELTFFFSLASIIVLLFRADLDQVDDFFSLLLLFLTLVHGCTTLLMVPDNVQ